MKRIITILNYDKMYTLAHKKVNKNKTLLVVVIRGAVGNERYGASEAVARLNVNANLQVLRLCNVNKNREERLWL